MKQVNYVMRKIILPHSKQERYIIKRYIFENDKMIESFWVNTYYNKHDAKDYFKIIKENIEYHKWNLIKETYGQNIWEISYR